jgi:hypothetical protein
MKVFRRLYLVPNGTSEILKGQKKTGLINTAAISISET